MKTPPLDRKMSYLSGWIIVDLYLTIRSIQVNSIVFIYVSRLDFFYETDDYSKFMSTDLSKPRKCIIYKLKWSENIEEKKILS